MTQADDYQALQAEIRRLRAEVEGLRNEFHRVSVAYAARHFQLQSDMRVAGIEELRGVGLEAECNFLRSRCRALEVAIEALRCDLSEMKGPHSSESR